MNNSKIENGLNDLLAKNYDAEKGFMEAADKIDNAALATLFRTKASQRYDFGHEIKTLITQMGGTINKGTSTLGDIHRAWIDFRTFFSANKEEGILSEVENGEEAAIREYNEFLANPDLSPQARKTIRKQRDAIKRTIKRVEMLEETYS